MRLEKLTTARSFACAVLVAGLLAAPARAQEVRAGDLTITQAWSRATPGGAKVWRDEIPVEGPPDKQPSLPK